MTAGVLVVTRFQLLYPDWRGYLFAGFALVWANVYMSLFGRLRLDIKGERLEIEIHEAERAAKSGGLGSVEQGTVLEARSAFLLDGPEIVAD